MQRGKTASGWIGIAAVLAVLGTAAGAPASPGDAPVLMAKAHGIPGQYIVVLKGALPHHPTLRSEHAATAEDNEIAHSVHARPLFDYDADLKGFAADLTAEQLRELRHNHHVKFIEQDERVTEQSAGAAADVETNPSWGLDRIDQRSLPLDHTYQYPATAGEGITAYVLDTGIELNHPDFEGRASFGGNFVDRTNGDANGHGTMIAGIVGGARWGVAKRVNLVSVKVLNSTGSGTWAGVIAGLNWITEHAAADKSVVSIAMGGGLTQAVDDATANLIASGVFVAAAAGNNNADACKFSPARVATAFTVGATDNQDRRSTFSNHGTCLDAYAPGTAITSDWIRGGTNTISGSSLAAPFVAGIAALRLAAHPSTPAELTQWLIDEATHGVVQNNLANTVNRLVFTPPG